LTSYSNAQFLTPKQQLKFNEPVEFCFSEEQAKKIAADLKYCSFDSVEKDLYIQDNNELNKEVDLLKQKVDLLKEVITLQDKTITQYQDLLKYQKESYKEIIEANKPSVWKQIFQAVGFVGIGVLIGLIF
jgi:hypothetical protein